MYGKRFRRVTSLTIKPGHGGLRKPPTLLPAMEGHGGRFRTNWSAIAFGGLETMGMEVKIVPDSATLNRVAVQEFCRLAESAIQERGRFSVALSGGNTPRSVY